MATVEKYEGAAISVFFDGRKCVHSRHCVLELPDVFRANVKGPWIDPDGADVERIAALAQRCPSGAITYERRDGKVEGPPTINTLRVLENGPLALCADIRLIDQTGEYRATLCRCGASHNKPFCDGSHASSGFVATGEPATLDSQPLAARGGVVEIVPFKDGPLGISGNLEIISGTGRTVDRVTKAALCRCGASKNKPYCDGSHAAVGFKAD
jgi:CDGSH-type Zn-finger protein/uncharacterized Fe-S cluster protein YjdI